MTTIRLATKTDMPQVFQLIQELAAFENEKDEVAISVADLERDGFGEHPKFTCFVHQDNSEITGMALVYMRYSTWKGTVLHLEDLIVNQNHRNKGIGTQLLNAVVTYGNRLKVKRISWEVLDWNSNAINFYKSKGANVLKHWHVVQLNANGITNYLKHI